MVLTALSTCTRLEVSCTSGPGRRTLCPDFSYGFPPPLTLARLPPSGTIFAFRGFGKNGGNARFVGPRFISSERSKQTNGQPDNALDLLRAIEPVDARFGGVRRVLRAPSTSSTHPGGPSGKGNGERQHDLRQE